MSDRSLLHRVLTALIDDSATGNSAIASASFTVDGGGAAGMVASDSAFDTATEAVEALFAGFPTAGVHEVCVSGGDEAGNSSNQDCILLAVFDPSAGFVRGGGWIDSPPGAYTPEDPNDPDILGRANFGFVSRYGVWIPADRDRRRRNGSIPHQDLECRVGRGRL